MGFRGVVIILALIASLLPAGRADASLDITPNPVFFSNGLVSGQIELVSVGTGVPAGGSVLEGSTGATDDTLVFQVTMFSGSIRRFGIGAFDAFATGIDSTGAGAIAGPDVDVSMFGAISGPSQRVFLFAGGGLVEAGEKSDAFFVSFDQGVLVEGGTLNFMITPGIGLGSTFSIDVPVVPGPGALAALAAAGMLGRRRRRRA